MSTAKVIEVIGEGKTIEEAVSSSVEEASKTVKGIQGVYVKNIQGEIENGKVTHYRVNSKITFLIEHT